MSHQASLSNHNPSNYSTNASFVYSQAYTQPIFDLLSAQPGEKIIDLGCGTGQLTEILRGLVGESGQVVGVDSSESMLDKAGSTATSTAITYHQADIQDFTSFTTSHPEYESAFDAVFTSATLHWCKSSPCSVVKLIGWLLRPGGRVAFEFGGFGNTVGVRQALYSVVKSRGQDPTALDPWYFPTSQQYETLLKSHNLLPSQVSLVPRPTPLPTGIYGWLTTFARNTWFSAFSAEEADELMKEVQEICRPDNYWCDDHPGVGISSSSGSRHVGEVENSVDKGQKKEGWEIMYVRLRGVATKPQ